MNGLMVSILIVFYEIISSPWDISQYSNIWTVDIQGLKYTVIQKRTTTFFEQSAQKYHFLENRIRNNHSLPNDEIVPITDKILSSYETILFVILMLTLLVIIASGVIGVKFFRLKKKWSHLFYYSQNFIIEFNKKMEICYLNKKAKEELVSIGLLKNERRKIAIEDLCKHECKDLKVRLQRIIKTGVPEQCGGKIIGKDKVIKVQANYVPQKNKWGKVETIIIEATDVTEIEKVSSKLLTVQKKYSAVIESSTDGIIVVDKKGVVLDCNTSTIHLLGLKSKNDLFSKDVFQYLMSESVTDKSVLLSKITNLKGVKNREFIVVTSKGEVVPVEFTSIFVEGDDSCYVMTIKDISVRKKSEENLRVTLKKLQYSNNEMAKLVYIISHDLKAPFRSILNLVEFLEEDLKELQFNDEMVTEKIDLLYTRLDRVGKLISNLQEYFCFDRVTYGIGTFELQSCIEDIIRNIDAPRGFSFNIKSKLPKLRLSKKQIQTVFSNILVNCVKHHNKEKANIDISCNIVDNYHQFKIEDDGPGIATEYQEKVFDLFQTLHSRDATEGSGMGLALVKKITEANEGVVKIESDGKNGTTVVLSLPIELIET